LAEVVIFAYAMLGLR